MTSLLPNAYFDAAPPRSLLRLPTLSAPFAGCITGRYTQDHFRVEVARPMDSSEGAVKVYFRSLL